jgi:hypothetical protein
MVDVQISEVRATLEQLLMYDKYSTKAWYKWKQQQ